MAGSRGSLAKSAIPSTSSIRINPKEVLEISWKKNRYGKDLGWGICLGYGDYHTVNRYRLDKLGESWFLTEKSAWEALNART